MDPENATDEKEVKPNESVQPEGNPPEEAPEGETSPATPEAPAEGDGNAPEGEPGEVTPAAPDEVPSQGPPATEPEAPVPDAEIYAKYPDNDSEAVDLALDLISLLAQLKRRETGGMKTVKMVSQLKNKIDLVSAVILAYGIKKGAEAAQT